MQTIVNTVFDTFQEAETFVRDYYREWHPAGYGTHLEVHPVLAPYSADVTGWRVYGGRSNSCE